MKNLDLRKHDLCWMWSSPLAAVVRLGEVISRVWVSIPLCEKWAEQHLLLWWTLMREVASPQAVLMASWS